MNSPETLHSIHDHPVSPESVHFHPFGPYIFILLRFYIPYKGFVIGSDKVFLEPVSLHIDKSEYYQALANEDISSINHKWKSPMLSNGKKDDDSSNSFGIESTIVQFEDCTSDDISVNLEFYFGNQLVSNETFRVSPVTSPLPSLKTPP